MVMRRFRRRVLVEAATADNTVLKYLTYLHDTLQAAMLYRQMAVARASGTCRYFMAAYDGM